MLCVFECMGIYFPSTPTSVDVRCWQTQGESSMLDHLLRTPKVTPSIGGAPPSSTRDLRAPEPKTPVVINDETAATFLAHAATRATGLKEGSVFTLQFTDGTPDTPAQVMILISLVQRLTRSTELRYVNCNGWEFRFKKVATPPKP